MSPATLRSYLDASDAAAPWLHSLGLRDAARGHRNLVGIAEQRVPLDLLAVVTRQLEAALPTSPDPDMALNNLERFFANSISPLSAAAVMERDSAALGTLVQLFGTSQYFSDLVVASPQYFEWLRSGWRGPRRREAIQDELAAELRPLPDGDVRLNTIRRFRQIEMLRIGFRDIVRDLPLEVITLELSELADAIVAVALDLATARAIEKHGTPRRDDGEPSRFVVLAMGKLGGQELNYSSDIDLVFLFDDDGATDGRRSVTNGEFWGRVSADLVKMLTAHTDRGQAYRVDLRLRPEGERGPIVRSLASTLAYYDALGRTWERQALIKVRPIAGDRELGARFVAAIEPFVYRRYLAFDEINEIKALKRRIEAASGKGVRNLFQSEKVPDTFLIDVKTGRGGIRDVEFVVQFLQLLNGGDRPELRGPNTLRALEALERAGCLTTEERLMMEENYRFLRKVEHRLQFMFDLQTHTLPESKDELERLARRLGYEPAGPRHATSARARFRSDLATKTDRNRRILDHLLHAAFRDDDTSASPEPESDLVLDPQPDADTIARVLGRYPFRDPLAAYRNLIELAREPIPFLSTPRCRHFLASIAPALLRELAKTPDPDMALANLEKVTASLGARGVLWELFSFNEPTLKLCVELCAWSQFLSQILISNPGMIDDLLDSLVLNQPRTLDELRSELADLCRGAENLELILHSFKDKEQLRIGVRDILGLESLAETTHALTDVAEVVLARIVEHEFHQLVERLGEPTIEDGPRAGEPCRLVVLALGKFGGQELGYHSDLDIIFVYESDGMTRIRGRRRGWEPTTNFHFFSELGQHIIRAAGVVGPHGRLYEVDPRLRPTGRSGSLVIPLDQFRRYYESGDGKGDRSNLCEAPSGPSRQIGPVPFSVSEGQLWERQALTRSRPVFGDAAFAREVQAAAEAAAYGVAWRPEMADEIRAVRQRLEESRGEADLKRGFGGIVDIEFIVQLLQLKHGPTDATVRLSNTWLALDRLRTAGYLDSYNHSFLWTSYEFLRRVESRLRIVHDISRDALPDGDDDLEKLARRLGYAASPGRAARDAFLVECDRVTAESRRTFLRVLERERSDDAV